MAYDRDWWDSASDYFNNTEAFNDPHLNSEERAENFAAFAQMLQQVEMGIRPQNTLGWAQLEAYGYDFEQDFDWEEFREWYDSQ